MGGPHTTDPLKVYIIQAKLDQDTIIELYNLLEQDKYNSSENFTPCNDINESDVVVTAIKMRKRLERHIDWEIAVRGLIVKHPFFINRCAIETKSDCYTAMATRFRSGWQSNFFRRLCCSFRDKQ